MPTISVGRDRLFASIGRRYTDEEFDALCFEFGIEVDDITTEKAIIRKEKHLEDEVPSEDEEVIYKVEVSANRYDLLCLEGLSRALRIFNGTDEVPAYNVASKASALQMHVKPATSEIRPYVVCAVLRGVTFDEARYNSFIDLQDRLHQNICRRRTLVAIGTHDLDSIHGPFTYEALPPQEINFIPLKQTKIFRADELMEFYKSDLKMKKFVHIIENSPVYPVIYDRNRTVLSLPPIINGAHSAITLKTKNVFIECTATDLNKANIVLNTMVTMFSEYCERKYEVEPVEIINPDGKCDLFPHLEPEIMDVSLSYINSIIRPLPAHEVASLLNKMQLRVHHTVSENNDTRFSLSIPPTRSDILHPIDVAGAVSNAYGYANIDMELPAFLPPSSDQFSSTSLKLHSLKEFSDHLMVEFASKGGYIAVPTWTLCSYAENFTMLRRKDDKSTAVVIMDPKSADFEVARTSLMPGLLKFLRSNLHRPKPIKIFEVDDVVLLDGEDDVGASNHRRIGILRCGVTSAFALIHGAVDKIMELAGYEFVSPGEESGYYLGMSDEPQFLEEEQASIILKGKKIGNFGIVHPEVLENFGIDDPCSYAELDVESLLL